MWFKQYFAQQQEEIRQQVKWVDDTIAERNAIADPGERLLKLTEFQLTLMDQYSVLARKRENSVAHLASDIAKGTGMLAGGFFAGLVPTITMFALGALATPAGTAAAAVVMFGGLIAGMWGGNKLVGKYSDRYADNLHARAHEELYNKLDSGFGRINELKQELLGRGLEAFADSPHFSQVRLRFRELSDRFIDAALRKDKEAPQAAPSTGLKATLTRSR